MSFDLKPKPERPKKKANELIEFKAYGSDSLRDVVDFFVGQRIPLENVYMYISPDHSVSFQIIIEETEESFNNKLDEYKKNLKEWKQWRSENQDEIRALLLEKQLDDQKVLIKLMKNYWV